MQLLAPPGRDILQEERQADLAASGQLQRREFRLLALAGEHQRPAAGADLRIKADGQRPHHARAERVARGRQHGGRQRQGQRLRDRQPRRAKGQRARSGGNPADPKPVLETPRALRRRGRGRNARNHRPAPAPFVQHRLPLRGRERPAQRQDQADGPPQPIRAQGHGRRLQLEFSRPSGRMRFLPGARLPKPWIDFNWSRKKAAFS